MQDMPFTDTELRLLKLSDAVDSERVTRLQFKARDPEKYLAQQRAQEERRRERRNALRKVQRVLSRERA